jgi:hypothetical protein
MLTREQLQRAASDTGFPIDSLEKVSMLVRLLNLMAAHPFLGPRVRSRAGPRSTSSSSRSPGCRSTSTSTTSAPPTARR